MTRDDSDTHRRPCRMLEMRRDSRKILKASVEGKSQSPGEVEHTHDNAQDSNELITLRQMRVAGACTAYMRLHRSQGTARRVTCDWRVPKKWRTKDRGTHGECFHSLRLNHNVLKTQSHGDRWSYMQNLALWYFAFSICDEWKIELQLKFVISYKHIKKDRLDLAI